MALTPDERLRVGTARLELIVADIYAAIKANDPDAYQAQRSKLQNFITDGTVPSAVRSRANETMLKIGGDISDSALDDMAEEADRLVAAGAGLQTAITVLESGKAELFFPTLASASKRLLELFKMMKEATDKIGDDITDVEGLEDLPDLIKSVSDKGDELLDKLKAAGKA